jgi:hypothetical protein
LPGKWRFAIGDRSMSAQERQFRNVLVRRIS